MSKLKPFTIYFVDSLGGEHQLGRRAFRRFLLNGNRVLVAPDSPASLLFGVYVPKGEPLPDEGVVGTQSTFDDLAALVTTAMIEAGFITPEDIEMAKAREGLLAECILGAHVEGYDPDAEENPYIGVG